MLESDAVQSFLKSNRKFISETEVRQPALCLSMDPQPVVTRRMTVRSFPNVVVVLQLQEIKEATGGRGRVEDGSVSQDKPLAQILREQKEAKDAKFQEQWKQMKTVSSSPVHTHRPSVQAPATDKRTALTIHSCLLQGKNRPLDEDEFEFLDHVAQAEAEQLQRVAEEEQAEIAAFQAALRDREQAAAATASAAEEASGKGAERVPGSRVKAPLPKPKAAVIKPRIKAIPRKGAPESAGTETNGGNGSERKKQKTENEAERGNSSESGEGVGLAGLLGGYGSDDDH